MTSAEPSTALRILLVEDSQHDRLAFERALVKSDMTFDLTVCARGEDLPAALADAPAPYHIAVVDFDLPGIDGLEAFSALPRRKDQPPFLMLTGAGSERLAVAAMQAGIYDYLVKDPYQGYLQLLPLKLLDVKQRHEDRVMRAKAEEELKTAYAHLEKLVEQRTAELGRTIQALEAEVAERRSTEAALRESERKLRALSRKVVETQENERKLVAKELHDSLGANLAAIKFAVEEIQRAVRKKAPESDAPFNAVVEHLLGTIQELRRISRSLRPSNIDDMGLLATMDWYSKKLAQLHGHARIETRFEVAEGDVPGFAKIEVYRILQEALNNALKHSRADVLHVVLEKDGSGLRMTVTDNGCGFDLNDARRSADPMTGYGLKGMHDRAELAGGSLTIRSSPGAGTTVRLDLPGRSASGPPAAEPQRRSAGP